MTEDLHTHAHTHALTRTHTVTHTHTRRCLGLERKPRNQQLADIGRYDIIVHHHRFSRSCWCWIARAGVERLHLCV
jgi:hypothetical protein